MKRIVFALLCISVYADMYGMEHIQNAWQNLWKRYTEWRNPATTQDLPKSVKDDKEASSKIIKVVSKHYEEEKPLYIKALSYISPSESEIDVVKRGYTSLNTRFNQAFYERMAGSLVFKFGYEQLTLQQQSELSAINSLLARKDQPDVSKGELESLIEKIEKFVQGIQGSLSLNEAQKQSLDQFAIGLKQLKRLLNEPRISAIERWHRNRIVDRMKSYLALQRQQEQINKN